MIKADQISVSGVGALQNGQYMSAGADKIVKLWDASGRLVRELKGHTDVVRALIEVDLGICSTSNDGYVRARGTAHSD